jgi:hypothetical protein
VATPFTISGELLLPVDPGQPNSPVPFGITDVFTSKADLELSYTGSATETVQLSTVASVGLKALLIELDAISGPTVDPVYIRFNGGDASSKMEISPGGFLAYGSPVPVAGIVSFTITHTTDCKIRLRALS